MTETRILQDEMKEFFVEIYKECRKINKERTVKEWREEINSALIDWDIRYVMNGNEAEREEIVKLVANLFYLYASLKK